MISPLPTEHRCRCMVKKKTQQVMMEAQQLQAGRPLQGLGLGTALRGRRSQRPRCRSGCRTRWWHSLRRRAPGALALTTHILSRILTALLAPIRPRQRASIPNGQAGARSCRGYIRQRVGSRVAVGSMARASAAASSTTASRTTPVRALPSAPLPFLAHACSRHVRMLWWSRD